MSFHHDNSPNSPELNDDSDMVVALNPETAPASNAPVALPRPDPQAFDPTYQAMAQLLRLQLVNQPEPPNIKLKRRQAIDREREEPAKTRSSAAQRAAARMAEVPYDNVAIAEAAPPSFDYDYTSASSHLFAAQLGVEAVAARAQSQQVLRQLATVPDAMDTNESEMRLNPVTSLARAPR
jgi:hypothetical protein